MFIMSNGERDTEKTLCILQIFITTIVFIITQQVSLGFSGGGEGCNWRNVADVDAIGHSNWMEMGSRGKGAANDDVGILS